MIHLNLLTRLEIASLRIELRKHGLRPKKRQSDAVRRTTGVLELPSQSFAKNGRTKQMELTK
jgi:hypothetical protein